jgi:hypothetical protein
MSRGNERRQRLLQARCCCASHGVDDRLREQRADAVGGRIALLMKFFA